MEINYQLGDIMIYISKIQLNGIKNVNYEQGQLGVKSIQIDYDKQIVRIDFQDKEWDYFIIPINDLHSIYVKEEDDGSHPYSTSKKKRAFPRNK